MELEYKIYFAILAKLRLSKAWVGFDKKIRVQKPNLELELNPKFAQKPNFCRCLFYYETLKNLKFKKKLLNKFYLIFFSIAVLLRQATVFFNTFFLYY